MLHVGYHLHFIHRAFETLRGRGICPSSCDSELLSWVDPGLSPSTQCSGSAGVSMGSGHVGRNLITSTTLYIMPQFKLSSPRAPIALLCLTLCLKASTFCFVIIKITIFKTQRHVKMFLKRLFPCHLYEKATPVGPAVGQSGLCKSWPPCRALLCQWAYSGLWIIYRRCSGAAPQALN